MAGIANRLSSSLFDISYTIYEISCSHANLSRVPPSLCRRYANRLERKRCFYFSLLVTCFVVNGSFVERSIQKYLSDFSRSKGNRITLLQRCPRFEQPLRIGRFLREVSSFPPLGAPRLLITTVQAVVGLYRLLWTVSSVDQAAFAPFPSAKGSSRAVGEEGGGGVGKINR